MNDALSTDRLVAYPIWTLSFAEDEDVVGLISPNKGPIASYGKVLANRTTLYKYLNPHMSVVLTAQRGVPSVAGDTNTTTTLKAPGCGVYVVDNVKGSVIYRASLPAPGPGARCNVKAVLTDNWLVYHYFDPEEGAVEEARGWRVVSVELYEGGIDEKTKRYVDIVLAIWCPANLPLVLNHLVTQIRPHKSGCSKTLLCSCKGLLL